MVDEKKFCKKNNYVKTIKITRSEKSIFQYTKQPIVFKSIDSPSNLYTISKVLDI